MQKMLFIMCLLLIVGSTYSGTDAISGKVSTTKGEQEVPNSIIVTKQSSIHGTVKDMNNKPLELITIIIKGTKIGTVTDQNGVFRINNLSAGNHTLIFSAVGYTKKVKSLNILDGQQLIVDLSLDERIIELPKILVVSNVGASEIKPQKIIYTIKELPSQAGGTSGDVLKNMPSVAMGGSPNQNRDIRYRGLGKSYTTVLINGRNAGATGNDRETVLDMIPASQVERIEILSNPSPDIQSDGINGVVNIILKNGTPKLGISGSLSFIEDNQDGSNGSVQFIQKWDKIQLSAGIDQLIRNADKEDTEALTKFNDDGSLKESANTKKDETKLFDNEGIRVNLLYQPNNTTSFTAEYLLGDQNEIKSKDELNLTFNPDGSFKKGTNRRETEDKDFKYHNIFLQSTTKLGNGGLLEASFHTNLSSEEKDKIRNDFKTNSLGNAEELNGPKRQMEYETKEKNAYYPEVSYRYTSGKSLLKSGYQGFMTSYDTKKTISNFNFDNNEYTLSPDNKNNFSVTENVHAFYTLAKWYKNKWNIEGGLRYEQIDIESESSVDTIPKGQGSYNLLLPNLSVLYELDKKSYLKVSLGRRVRRPSYKDVNPFVEIKSVTEIKRGNPSLKPELAWAYETGYLRKFNIFDFGINAFYRDISNLIQKNKYEDNNGVIVEEPVNLNGARVYGVEILMNLQPTEWWDINLNYSKFYSEIKDSDSDFDGDALKDQTDWTAKIISDFSLPADITFQVAGSIVGPKLSSQETEDTIWSFDAGFQKTILQNGIFVVRIVDVFDTLRKTKTESTGTQIKDKVENTHGQIVSAGLKWNF